MKKDNEETIIRKLLRRVHRAGNSQSLSRSQKKMILNDILPRQQFVFRYAPALMGATLVAFMLVGFPVVNASKPNSFLYGVKRTIEDVRSFVQPSFNEELIDKRDAEIEDAKNRGDHEAAAIVEQEKSEIEQRLSGDDSSSSDETNTQDGQNQTETETEHTQTNDNVSSSTETETEHQQGGGGSDDSTPATTEPSSTSTQNRSARDVCRDALDAQRRAGVSINSDLYKACDKL